MSEEQIVLIATRSEGKLREMKEFFRTESVKVVSVADRGIAETAEEDGLEEYETFEENALAKARYFYRVSGGTPTIADDSGLVVECLGGAPGVRSKRWSGRMDVTGPELDAANNAKLLEEMKRAAAADPSASTSARYVTVVAYVDGDFEMTRRGEIEGRILTAPRGNGGFGYDPLFESAELGGTYAESTPENTAQLSQRARAFKALLAALRAEGRLR